MHGCELEVAEVGCGTSVVAKQAYPVSGQRGLIGGDSEEVLQTGFFEGLTVEEPFKVNLLRFSNPDVFGMNVTQFQCKHNLFVTNQCCHRCCQKSLPRTTLDGGCWTQARPLLFWLNTVLYHMQLRVLDQHPT